MWFIVVPKLKFGHFREGEIIRIRSVNINVVSKRNVLQCKNNTNILRFTQNNPIMAEMQATVEDETEEDKLKLDDSNTEVLMSPVMLTEITDPEMS